MADEITFDDCCRIILEDAPSRREEIVPALRDYKRHLLALLTREFGIDWQDDWTGFGRMEGLPSVVLGMPRGYVGIRSPYADYLEYTPMRGERDVNTQHKAALEAAERVLKQRWVALFRDLLQLRWPDAAHRKTSWSRLRALGLGEQQHEADFW